MRRFWIWYDKLNEPWRLLLLLLYLAIGLGATSTGFQAREPNPYLIFGGLGFIFFVGLSRAWYMGR